jgi:hypothetical protein
MSATPLYSKALPGSLSAAVAGLRPTLPLDDVTGQAVGNWVAHDQTTSNLAAPIAEPYLHGYLQQADRVGVTHGRAACLVLYWPLTIALFILGLIFFG